MKVAVITVLFDYPDYYTPIFQDKLLDNFPQEDYYVVRYKSENEIIRNESYYFKFTHFRIKNLLDFITSNISQKYDYFLHLDATDVGYVGGIEKIPQLMMEYDCSILFGGERNLWPNTDYSHLYENKKTDSLYKYLNAGVFCAETNSFISHAKEILNRGLSGLCDQGNWQIEYLLNSDIKIDYDNKLVLNSYLAKEDIIISDQDLTFKTNKPIFVHDNGGFNDHTIKIVNYFL